MKLTRPFQAALILCFLLSISAVQADERPKTGLVKAEQRVAQLTPNEEQELLRFVMQATRVILAMAYSDPQLVLREAEEFDRSLRQVDPILERIGDPESLQEVRALPKLIKLDTAAEIGLVDDFAEKSAEFVPLAEDPDNKVTILSSGIKMAFRQQAYDDAAMYIRRAREIVDEYPGKVSPVYLMFLDTAETRLEMEQGLKLTDEQIVDRYERAWAHLSSYHPNDDMTKATTWYHGRWASRFWIEELARIDDSELTLLGEHIGSFLAWIEQADINANLTPEQAEDPFDQIDRAQGFFTLSFAVLDLTIFALEQRPDLVAVAEAGGLTDELDKQLDSVVADTRAMCEKLTLPGMPPFDLTQSAFLTELRLRSRLLRGLNPSKPEEERVAVLQALDPDLEQLRLPESYIHYQIALGKAYRDAGRPELAPQPWERALAKAEKYGFQSQVVEASSLLATEYGALKNWEKARLYAAKANAGIQNDIGSLYGEVQTDRSSQLAQIEAQAHLESNNPELALQALSQGHQMGNAVVRLRGNKEASEATVALNRGKKRVSSLSQKVDELKQMPQSELRDELLGKAEKLLAESRSEFLLQSRQIRKQFSDLYSSTLRFDPLNLPDIQKSLPPDGAVVQYFATEDELYIFLVTRDLFRLRSVKVGKQELDQQILGYLQAIKRVRTDNLDKYSTNLYSELIEPIEQDLEKAQLVVLIPVGKLNILPFGSLQSKDGKALLEKKTILELAQPTDFMKIAFSQPSKIEGVVAFANATEDLPSAEVEGKTITSIFPNSRLFTGSEANKANLVRFGGDAQVLHLATHGVTDASDSLQNYLLLADRERLAQEEIFNLDLQKTDLVTLSACNTAAGEDKDTDYVASLAEAFWIAGSKTVVASLWPVDDESTGRLMTRFYEGLRAGESRAEALKEAQLAVRSDPQYSHPYFWSGFVLFGDYR